MIENKNNRYLKPIKLGVMVSIAASAILSIIPQANALNLQTKNGTVTSSNSEVLLIAQTQTSSQSTRCYNRRFITEYGRPYIRRVCQTTTTGTTTTQRKSVCRYYPFSWNGRGYTRRVCN
ncbi:hypothetical protein [Nostoc sp.]|uniref:hypothetical protein n=1 Tax=Nostoc sp. TaxID=1180 RepID=UPI002FF67390